MKGVKKQSQIKKYLYLFRIGKLTLEKYELALYYNLLCIENILYYGRICLI